MKQNRSTFDRERIAHAILEVTQPIILLGGLVAAAAAAARFAGGC